jgi:cephalosporin hydroxylase
MKRFIRDTRRRMLSPLHRRQVLRELAAFHGRRRSLEEVVDYSLVFPGKGCFRIRTKQIRAEILGLSRAVAEVEPKVILEIGTSSGGSLFIWANLASEKVVTSDIMNLRIREPMFHAFAPPGSQCVVEFLCGDSHAPPFRERVVEALGGKPVDFLFIDGDHTEAGVESDYRAYAPLVRPGGLVAFHDIVERQPLPTNQVQHFWKRLKAEQSDTEEFVADHDQVGYGIGLVRLP